ncbi:MAG: tRNA (adenosine(37)-N6)-dimethylallyltransferase MiaA [Vicingaceae bacterium]
MNTNHQIVVILGPTASGKTNLAVNFAFHHKGAIISADSRQVYKTMDIGTGKDLSEYIINGKQIPYYLIDITEPGDEYNVYRYQNDFLKAYFEVIEKNQTPVLCGGTGMYIEAAISGYRFIKVPENKLLRAELKTKSKDQQINLLKQLKPLHNTSDIKDDERLIRAIEIAVFEKENAKQINDYPKFNAAIFGIKIQRNQVRKKITERLKFRLENGMIEEVENLLNNGVTQEKLIYYGLEYKFLTQYVLGELSYNDMFQKLNSAIHQFAKRQMTWFRRMERNGFKINWVDYNLPLEEKLKFMVETLKHTF